MAKKDPASPEWITRCVDSVLAVSDGSREKDLKAGYSIFLTLPPFSDLGSFSGQWRKMAEHALEALTSANAISEVKIDGKAHPRTQYLLSGEGGFREAEDKILGMYGEMFGEIMGDCAEMWKARLEQSRPTDSMDKPGKMAAELEKSIPASVIDSIPDLKSALARVKNDPYDLSLLPALIGAKGAVEAKAPAAVPAMTECMDALLGYRNSIRMKSELWIERAFLPLSSPYLAPLFRSQSGETPSFRNISDYYGKLAQQVFGEDFSKTPRMALESAGVFNAKTFPVSPFKLRAGAPYVTAKDSDVSVRFGWLQARLHWMLETAVLNALAEKFGAAATLIDSRKNSKVRYPDPFGLETINTQQLNIRMKSPEEARQTAGEIGTFLKSLYEKDFVPVNIGEDYRILAEKLIKETDLISQKAQSDIDRRMEKKRSMKIENRIVPYANKPSVYIQVVGEKLPIPLYEAIKETLESYPDWKTVLPNGNSTSYISLHLSAPHTSEAAGLAERHSIAYEVSRKYTEKTGENKFPVQYPDSGYRIEVTKRRINPQDKTDETSGIYVKLPVTFVPGGVLEEKSMEDDSIIDDLDPVSRGFYDLGEEFGRGAQKKSIFKLFTPASSPLETYTRTWLYKIKPDDNEEEKLGSIKDLLESRIAELFPADVPLEIDWMPDKAARKLDAVNSDIDAFAGRWADMYAAEKNVAVEMEI